MIKSIVKSIFSQIGIDIRPKRSYMYLSQIVRFNKIESVIDIGANVGQFALSIKNIDKNIDVHSFEPIPIVFSDLKKNMAKFLKFTPYNIGLGNSDGELEITINQFSPSSSFLELGELHLNNFEFAQPKEKEIVLIKRLDDVIDTLNLKQNILIKIDVQGFEDQVIAGGNNTIRNSKIIIIEVSFRELYKGQKLFGDIFNTIVSFNFEFIGILNETFDAKKGDLLFGDAIFRNLNHE